MTWAEVRERLVVGAFVGAGDRAAVQRLDALGVGLGRLG
jgi:hypothetical protein